MMWSVVFVLAAALSVESYAIRDQQERLNHGGQLKIYLPKSAETLEFTPADEPGRTSLLWGKGHRTSRGRVSGTGSDRRWYVDKVTYEDQGTYTQRDFWNKEISNVKVAVITKRNFKKCIVGESLYISLEGIDLADSFLYFSGAAANVTLVQDGARVSQDLPDYWDRVQTHSMNIEIRNVNYSDEGHYTLKDRKNRVVSISRMEITDHHEGGNPLLALLLLLGIPAGICCCCRKKIFKKKATTASTLQTTPDAVHPPPSGPVGPAPPYNTPGQPGVMYYHGPDPSMGPQAHPPPQWSGPAPAPGFNPAYPPQNLPYPPAGPAMVPPQWNGPSPGQYPPGQVPPMGYAPAPVMFSAAPPAAASENVPEVKMSMDPSPADPLLTATPQAEAASSPVAPVPPSTNNFLSSNDGACQFKID
ncbi:wu:fc21g02 [Centropristis striata]|uniref:wu:fc21g02 n=1 Tax=Centropristis striata TaxID=184440 RepID=UPI0027E0AFB0|nr:wu:fc21g02 [Centropristis striata]